MNNTLERINSRIIEAEQMHDLEDRIWKSLPENKIEKRMKRRKESLRDLWGNLKDNNIHIIGVPEGEERKDLRKYLKT